MIGEVLRKARKNKRYTMAQIAEMVGVTTGYISNLEKNRLEPSLSLLRNLADKLGVAPSSLISDETAEFVTVIRASEHPRLRYHNLPLDCVVLSPLYWHNTCADEIEAVLIYAEPERMIPLSSVSSDADICIYVLSGSVTYHFGAGSIPVSAGGSIFIPRNTGERIETAADSGAQMIWMTKSLASIQQMSPVKEKQTNAKPSERAAHSHLQLLGERIRSLRKSHGIDLKTFAQTVGVTPAYISQIERDLTEPSLRVLRRIAKELHVELTLLFASDMPSNVFVTQRDKRDIMRIVESNSLLQLLVPYQTLDERMPDMSVVLVDLGAGQADSAESIVHDYDELCIVLEGGVEYQTPEGTYPILAGDTLYIRKGIHHTIFNSHDESARILVVLGSALHRSYRSREPQK